MNEKILCKRNDIFLARTYVLFCLVNDSLPKELWCRLIEERVYKVLGHYWEGRQIVPALLGQKMSGQRTSSLQVNEQYILAPRPSNTLAGLIERRLLISAPSFHEALTRLFLLAPFLDEEQIWFQSTNV